MSSVEADAAAGAAKPAPRFATALAAGAGAGLSVDLMFYPIDTLKTRLQAAQGFWAAGGFRGIYKGMSSVALGSAPGAATFFVTYESMKPVLLRALGGENDGRTAALSHMGAASAGETAACLIRVPTEVVKSRLQTLSYGHGAGVATAVRAVWQEAGGRGGLRGFYTGFASTVGREIPFTCIQFPLYEWLRQRAARAARGQPGAAKDALPAPHHVALAGSAAGAVAAALTTPLDVAKTRIMLHRRSFGPGAGAGAAGPTPDEIRGVNTRVLPTLLHVWRTEGTAALWSGLVPRTIWIGLGGAVFLGSFDLGVRILQPEAA